MVYFDLLEMFNGLNALYEFVIAIQFVNIVFLFVHLFCKLK